MPAPHCFPAAARGLMLLLGAGAEGGRTSTLRVMSPELSPKTPRRTVPPPEKPSWRHATRASGSPKSCAQTAPKAPSLKTCTPPVAKPLTSTRPTSLRSPSSAAHGASRQNRKHCIAYACLLHMHARTQASCSRAQAPCVSNTTADKATLPMRRRLVRFGWNECRCCIVRVITADHIRGVGVVLMDWFGEGIEDCSNVS